MLSDLSQKQLQLCCKFQAVIVNQLEPNWRVLDRPYSNPIHEAETPSGRTDPDQCLG
jgi:hypothetical protein